MRTTDHFLYGPKLGALGRGNAAAAGVAQPRSAIASDAKLFAMTFVAGFMFTAIFIA